MKVKRLLCIGMAVALMCFGQQQMAVQAQEITAEESSGKTMDASSETGEESISSIGDDVSSEVIDSGTCGENVQWSLSGDGTLNITGTGEMDDYYLTTPWCCNLDPSDDPREKYVITKVIMSEGITGIGYYIFSSF